MKILIIGCGRVGSRLAQQLERAGHELIVFDFKRETFARLGGNFRGVTIQASGLDGPALRKAGIETCDVVIAVTGGDNRNLMIAQVAKIQFGRTRVMARLKDPVRAAKFQGMGIDTLCVTTVVSGLLELWTQNGSFPELPSELSVSGDASALYE